MLLLSVDGPAELRGTRKARRGLPADRLNRVRLSGSTRRSIRCPSPDRRDGMAHERPVRVHLLPALAPPGELAGGVAVVIDVLRATTVIVHALAAGCVTVVPCGEIEEAKARAKALRSVGKVLLGGERCGKPIPGFDVGNSPGEYTAKACK